MLHPPAPRDRSVYRSVEVGVATPSASSSASRSYRWSVGHASGRKLKVRRSLRGRKVACRVTATNAAGSTTASSEAVRAR
jgi:hypothetical protein